MRLTERGEMVLAILGTLLIVGVFGLAGWIEGWG